MSQACLICNADLHYDVTAKMMRCVMCNHSFESNAKCINGHFVCNTCHEEKAFDYIESYCNEQQSNNVFAIANKIMRHSSFHMHGPEHHFLVPAVLITAYYNHLGQHQLIKPKLIIAKKRAKQILGGFCGFYGSCGAAIGTGIFLSVVLETTPVSENEWRLCNLITATSLHEIANHGGPRCCKRDTFLALEMAIPFIKENLNIELPSEKISCAFSSHNKECKQEECKYFNSLSG
jgi:hypothetical protein